MASCHGFGISRNDALEVLANIENVLQNSDIFDEYHQTVEETKGSEINSNDYFFSNSVKYCHSYEIKNNSFSAESWNYVKNDIIYRVVRNISVKGEEIIDQYTTTEQDYTDLAWKEISDVWMNRIVNLHLETLNGIKTLIKDETSNLDLKSANANSIYILSTQETEGSEKFTTKYEAVVLNNKLSSIVNETSETTKIINRISYSIGDIYYPDIDKK